MTTQQRGTFGEVFVAFLVLGLTSFGGPIAHLAYFRTAFVERRKWLTEAEYGDLVALCQFLPGPASSQVGFLIGQRRAGWAGAAAAWFGFTAPSAALMIAAAFGATWFATNVGRALAHGLQLVAFAVVAQAVYGMARNLCRTPLTIAIAVAAAAALLALYVPWLQIVIIAAGAAIGFAFAAHGDASPQKPQRIGPLPALLFTLFAALLIALPLLAPIAPLAELPAAFFRAGALVFGGGHVVLPLLEQETVARHWLSEQTFLAGYGAAQAMPGPLFTFAAFLGAAGSQTPNGVAGGLIALVFIFLPGLLLAAAAAPVWARIKSFPRAAGLIAGANAAVVGVLAAALYNPVFTSAVSTPPDFALGAAGFAALQFLKAPSWLVVLVLGAAGAALALA